MGVFSEPEPDIAITFQPSEEFASRQPLPNDLALIVEVSDTTLRTDLLVKGRLYSSANIPEYWVLDLVGRQMHVHRKPENGRYIDLMIFSESESVSPISMPASSIKVGKLLPPASR